ncbi:MAG: type V CRISPR-associated protein Cas12a/Cpf1 [Bacteroidaceae bacterium]|nr:type V CRISPR-associated protein Cas12a/Cpf1 [Bacteroidaceae bacterium]
MNNFTNLYQVSKTLRFELIPIGKTKKNIEENGILERDNKRAVSYKSIKKVIDERHKEFIEQKLNAFKFKMIEYDGEHIDPLDIFNSLYHSTGQNRKKSIVRVQDALRKQISEHFTNSHEYKRLFGKELIREDLALFVTAPRFEAYIRSQKGNENLNDDEVSQIQNEVKEEIEEFKDFTTYFSGFYENRKNMYVADDKATSIANRLINENLPKFIDNMDVFTEIAASEVAAHFDTLYKAMEAYLNVNSIPEMFQLDYFSIVLTQKQIDVYNAIIGGMTLKDGTKIQGLNEYVNLYNQQHRDDKLPKLKPLFKQILSERNAISWLPEEFASDNDMLESIEKCYQDLREQVFEGENSLKKLLEDICEYDLEHIFLSNDSQLINIAQKQYRNKFVINQAFEKHIKTENPRRGNETNEKYEARIEKILKASESISIAQINRLINDYTNDYLVEDFKPIETYFTAMGAENDGDNPKPNLFVRVEKAYEDAKTLLTTIYPNDKKLSQDKANVEKIKNLMDALMNLQHFVKPLLGKGTEGEKDNRFYGEFISYWEKLDQISKLYNMVRNRMTQKPYSDEKIKLNFDNSTLLSGWDINKEIDNKCTILRKNGMYYLVIINKNNNKVLTPENIVSEGECYEKLVYKQLGQISKQLPRIAFSNSWQQRIKIDDDVLRIKNTGSFKTNNDDLQKLIDFYKYFISQHEEWNKFFKIEFVDRKNYTNIIEFFSEVDSLFYSLSFSNVSVDYINQLVDEGKIYLFQIYNKDFSQYSKGTPNLHTMYWKMLFDERNLANVVYKLNGDAEIFFRKHSINVEKPTHPANTPIENKNKLNNKKTSKFKYDLIKDRRYTVDKFLFHVPITMNYKAMGMKNINPKVNAYLKESTTTHIIGIDRGERHLLYLSLIDLQGNIIEQYSLNEIVNEYKGNTYSTNYHDLLDAKEKQRDEARRSWLTIENIKDLKEGYMSQVIHKISDLMVKYNAIVVLEDLNLGFMRERQKVEKQVYQKFEKMLIDKLNYLVDKKRDVVEIGGVLKAYQLTNKFESFQKIGKQSGCLFYVPAWNTSKMDPTTGFVNLLDTRYKSIEKAKEFINKFQSICYNDKQNWFEFTFDYNDFTTKAAGTRTQWTLCTYGTRIETQRDPKQNNMFVSVEFDLTDRFKKLFNDYKINLQENLKEHICSQNKSEFFKSLLYLLHMTLQMRNSKTGTDIDYMLSPVMTSDKEFYDSRKCDQTLPENADANGAYNIARKGLWIIEQIKKADDLSNVKLAISNKEWMRYAQGLE